MAVEGLQAEADGQKEPVCGLLRSRNGGHTWQDFTIIARGLKQPSVLLMGENKLVTMLCRDEALFRCTSSDSGHR